MQENSEICAERRILAERVYIRPKSVSERNLKTKYVSGSKIQKERAHTTKSLCQNARKQRNMCLAAKV